MYRFLHFNMILKLVKIAILLIQNVLLLIVFFWLLNEAHLHWGNKVFFLLCTVFFSYASWRQASYWIREEWFLQQVRDQLGSDYLIRYRTNRFVIRQLRTLIDSMLPLSSRRSYHHGLWCEVCREYNALLVEHHAACDELERLFGPKAGYFMPKMEFHAIAVA